MKLAKRFLLAVFCFLAAVFLLVIFTARIPAGPPAQVASQNGDTNGDGMIDVSDAVHLLLYLFKGGDPPAALARASPVVDEKITSIDGHLASIAASHSATNEKLDALVGAISDLVDVQAGALETRCADRLDRFVDNGNGTVTDTCTSRMWQKRAVFSSDYNTALAHVESLDLGGHSDWRLPTARELETVIHLGKEAHGVPTRAILVHSAIWPGEGEIWSADTNGEGLAWTVTFLDSAFDTDRTGVNCCVAITPRRHQFKVRAINQSAWVLAVRDAE